ncbi:MAG: PHP domain-containing protein [Anaerovibrio sp.]|uniref:PHP domain-containing protein n=1 Tax=Anaerovibrio sp. TaxID=1872532 RepID=UPI0025CEDA64|nr:PHP domain-containing protein [Anaerovibrio sp.]MCR5176709.1 PHP domain-containing protein [Anaerovibrio sp.]
MSSDLHMHTRCSDGLLNPEEIVDAAKAAGLNYIAITDHDTVNGICQLYEAGLYPAKGIKIIPGIEFSAHHETQEIHILGYNIDIYDKNLTDKLNDVVEARWSRFSSIVKKLQEMEYDISETDVLEIAEDSTSISRSHIAQAMVKKGYFSSVRACFEEILEKGRPAYVSHFRLEPGEIIDLIKQSGGIPVLAHPKLIRDDVLVEQLLKQGIEGVEAFYPKHDSEDTARYLEMANRYNLMVTGGSDFHGIPGRSPLSLGDFVIDDSYAAELYRDPNM